MAEPHPHPILIGTSGWSYADWDGPFYPQGKPAGDYLEYYADRFPIVEVDSSFYRAPTAKMVRAWLTRTPDDFRFTLKVPQVITHQKQLRDCEGDVADFLTAIDGLRPKVHSALLQMGYFNRQAFPALDEFLRALDDFLGTWPLARVPLAVEIRNPRWVTDEYLAVLRKHGAAFTLTEQKWMPTVAKLAEKYDPVTGPFACVRLIGDRESIEKVTTTWDKTVLDRAADLAEIARVLAAMAERVPVVVFVNNHYSGYSPATVEILRGLLGLRIPVPPERPRTTLFD